MIPRRLAMLVAALAASAALLAPRAATASQGTPEDRHPPLTLAWLATQTVPSPGVAFGHETAFVVRWQVTPILYSFGRYHEMSPWRFFVVEPIMRMSGSIEIFASPEYATFGERAAERWFARAGARLYAPVIQRGEYLAVSVGASAYDHQGEIGPTFEVGVYSVLGIVGLQLGYSPRLYGGEGSATLCLRYF